MKNVFLDGNQLKAREGAQAYLKEVLELPEHYGGNLDALHDCLTECSDTEITISRPDEETMYYKRLLRVFKQAQREGAISLTVTEEPAGRHQSIQYRYDTQLLIEGQGLDEDAINDYFRDNFKGDCLLAVGDEELIKIHYHTNEPWLVLAYCASLGEIFDIVVEDMDRQARGLRG